MRLELSKNWCCENDRYYFIFVFSVVIFSSSSSSSLLVVVCPHLLTQPDVLSCWAGGGGGRGAGMGDEGAGVHWGGETVPNAKLSPSE